MRALGVLVPVLLSGCVLLNPVRPGPAIVPVPSSGIQHDGYVLFCDEVPIEACQTRADRIALDSGRGRQIRSIVVRPDGHELCWDGVVAGICEGAIEAAATPRP